MLQQDSRLTDPAHAPTTYLYLHGFASSPRSAKAVYLRDRFQELQIDLQIPDLNQGDFAHLTLTRQIQQIAAELPKTPVTLIGSSLGGLVAAWIAQQHPQVQHLILLAPAFEFLTHWLHRLGSEQVDRWQRETWIEVYHHGEQHSLPLHYLFLEDARQYQDADLQRPVPTLILHGIHDEVIPVQASRDFALERPWTDLIELDSDHALGDVQPQIWTAVRSFLDLDQSF